MTARTAVDVPPPPVVRLPAPWSLHAVDPAGPDLALVHGWMRAPHVAAFWRQPWPLDRWRAELTGQLAGDHSRPCLVSEDGSPVLYLEVYRVARDRVAACYPAGAHDLGLHVAVGELAHTGRGLVRRLLPVLATALFQADPRCRRLVLEPDVANRPAIRAFQAGGFTRVGEITLPDKTAELLVLDRPEELS
jgi:RimJ/RimL family protein N-acetyltransferase